MHCLAFLPFETVIRVNLWSRPYSNTTVSLIIVKLYLSPLISGCPECFTCARVITQVFYIIWSKWARKQESTCYVSSSESELIMALWLLAGLDEDALHGAPPVVLVGRAHTMHLTLAADGVAILLTCHTQIYVCAHVFEAHSFIALPVDALTLHRPHVQVVALAILSKSADLLVIRQGGAEVVCVEVPASLHVCDADGLTTLDGYPTLTRTIGLPTNLPITVGIICVLHSSYRLLSTAWAVLDIVGVQADVVPGVEQFDQRAARHVVELRLSSLAVWPQQQQQQWLD